MAKKEHYVFGKFQDALYGYHHVDGVDLGELCRENSRWAFRIRKRNLKSVLRTTEGFLVRTKDMIKLMFKKNKRLFSLNVAA